MRDEIVVDGVVYTPKQKEMSNRIVVRCRNAGVHVGTKVSRDENTLVLKDANRIWKWSGAFTLSEVAMNGVDRDNSRIATLVPEVTLTVSDVCEEIPVAGNVDLTECNND